MFKVEVRITVHEQEKYGSNTHASSQRETLATGDNLDAMLDHVAADCLSDVLRQTDIRRSAQSAAS